MIFEEEKNYFDDVLKKKNLHLKMNPQDQITKLEGLARKTKSTDTAREYEKLKRDMIAKSRERHGEEAIFGDENLEGSN